VQWNGLSLKHKMAEKGNCCIVYATGINSEEYRDGYNDRIGPA